MATETQFRPTEIQYDLTYHELARRLLLHQTITQIAKDMNLATDLVLRLQQKEDFKRVYAHLRDSMYSDLDRDMKGEANSIREQIAVQAGKSMEVLTDLLASCASQTLRVNIAQDMLDRAGYSKQPQTPQQVSILINPIDASALVTALNKETEGQLRLESQQKLAEDLAKLPTDLEEHPLVQSQRATPGSEKKSS